MGLEILNNLENQVRKKIRKNKRKRWIAFAAMLIVTIITLAGVYIRARLSQAEQAIHQKVETVNLRDKAVAEDGSFSVLLLGIDNGAYGRSTDVGRSDTMLVVTVNEKKGVTKIVSIPRDSYTEIIGYGTSDKINHAYAFGREQMSINSVQNMLNIPIDYYVTVDMNGLMGLVDAVGGLDITPSLTFTYEDESFTEGVDRHVDGEAALRYARMRYDDPEGDAGRQKRQQYVIKKLVEKLLSIGSVTRYEEILKTLENSVRTNFTIDKLVSIQQKYPKALRNFESDTINGDGAMIGGVYYFVIPEEEKLRIANVLRESLDLEKITALKHIETNVEQTTVNIEEHRPDSAVYEEGQEDTYVEPAYVAPQTTNRQNPTSVTPQTNRETTGNNVTTQETTVSPQQSTQTTVTTEATTQTPAPERPTQSQEETTKQN